MDITSSFQRISRAIANRRRVVEEAEAFLTANLAEPVAIDDLCGVTGVSERALRNAFNDVYGVSPKRYILQARLARVRDVLASGDSHTVTTVATDFGFFELGRFASHYKDQYGEYPSDTLRHAMAMRYAN